jgi:hypothetical protein
LLTPLLVAAVLPGRPEEQRDPDDDPEEGDHRAEDEDLGHVDIIVPASRRDKQGGHR